jgi:hypothetical protein
MQCAYSFVCIEEEVLEFVQESCNRLRRGCTDLTAFFSSLLPHQLILLPVAGDWRMRRE